MIRKWIKRGIKVGLLVAIGIVALQVGLTLLSGSNWLHKQVAGELTEATGREVRFGKILLDLRGLAIEDFELSKEGGLEKGSIAHIHHLNLKISWLYLLKGEVKIVFAEIDGLSIEAVRNKNGQLNFDFSSSEAEENSTTGGSENIDLPVDITIDRLSFRKMHFSYRDEQTSARIQLQDTDLAMYDFSLDKPFEVRLRSSINWQATGQEQVIQLGLAGRVELAELDLSKAKAEIKDLSLRSSQARLHTKATVSNWTDPVFSLQITWKNLTEEALKGFVTDVQPFSIEQLTFTANGALAPQARMVRLDQVILNGPGLDVNGSGKSNWGNSTYSFTAQLKADMAEMEKNISYFAPYKPQGTVSIETQGTEKEISAQAQWDGGGLRLPRVGDLADVEMDLKAQEQMDFKQGNGTLKLTGKLNGEPFQTDLTLAQTPKKVKLELKALADKFILPPAPPQSADETSTNSAPAGQAPSSAWPFAPADITADVQVGYLDIPYLNGKSLDFKTRLSGVTPSLKGVHGQFDFSIGNGVITDLYHLTTSNPLARVLFLSLSVVGKVFNSLDVLSVLGGIAGIGSDKSAVDSGEEVIQIVPGEDGEPVAIKVPASSRKVEGALPYDKFITDIQFDDGVATIQKGHFVSNMMSFNLTGTTDFNTEKLDMTVNAAPGKHETDGIMPLTLKIGGTIAEPKGNMKLIGSVASLVKQGVTNNFASRAVKNTVSGFFGLFKKKEKEEAQPQPQENIENNDDSETDETAVEESEEAQGEQNVVP